MSVEERAARAATFRAALQDGVIKEVLDEIEAQFTSDWKTARTPDERENCWRAVNILSLLRQKMGTISVEPKLHSADVTQIRRAR